MPIRINLLAEEQAAEDLRRRDPVKRGIMLGAFLIALVLIWIGKLQVDVFIKNTTLKRLETRWTSIEQKYRAVTDSQRKTVEIESKVASLNRLSTNRFLWGSVLNALQQTMVDQIQVTRLKTDQSFVLADAMPAKTNGNKIIPRQPATSTEKIGLTIGAKDWNPSEQTYNKFKETLSNSPYFSKHLREGFILTGTLSALTADPLDPGHGYVSFTLESHFPPNPRSE